MLLVKTAAGKNLTSMFADIAENDKSIKAMGSKLKKDISDGSRDANIFLLGAGGTLGLLGAGAAKIVYDRNKHRKKTKSR